MVVSRPISGRDTFRGLSRCPPQIWLRTHPIPNEMSGDRGIRASAESDRGGPMPYTPVHGAVRADVIFLCAFSLYLIPISNVDIVHERPTGGCSSGVELRPPIR